MANDALSLSVVVCLAEIVTTQEQGCQPGPPPIPAVYIPIPTEHVRRGDNFIPIFAQIAVPEGNTDNDWCPLGFILYDRWYVVRWYDYGAGGEFGYFDEQGRWIPHNGDLTTHYRTAYWDKESGKYVPIEPRIVRISVEVDDYADFADDLPQNSSDWNLDSYFTVWEFWITPCPYQWRPELDEDLSFTAWIEPLTDHKGNPMVGTIVFLLNSSYEPGHCLNDCRLGSEGEWSWDGTTGCHDDFQFLPEQPNLIVYPRDQTLEGVGYNYDTAMSSWATNMAVVTVRCLDYGGWTYLVGYVIGFFGEGAARRIDAQELFVVDIPVDENDNHIADYWENLIDPPSRDPLSDDDIFNEGDGTDGDGLSLYEEYRGLMIRGTWQSLNPWIKDMFVMNFGAGTENPYTPAVIPNEAITSPDGFVGAGMPLLWLLNANEGSGYPLRVVNFLWGYAHRRDVYAAIVVPDEDGQPDLAWTLGPIWDEVGLPIIEVNDERLRETAREWGVNEDLGFAMVVGHELGHTVLWHVDHNPGDDSQEFGGDAGHHVIGQDGRVGQQTIHCLMWPYFPPVICPGGFALCWPQFCPQSAQHWANHPNGWLVFTPTEFCDANPGCQHLWRLRPPQ